MAKLTPMVKKKKMEESASKKTDEKKKIVLEDNSDDDSDDIDFDSEDDLDLDDQSDNLEKGGNDDSEDDDDDDDEDDDDEEESPALVKKSKGAAIAPSKQQKATIKKGGKMPQKTEAKTPANMKGKQTPAKEKKGKVVVKEDVSSDDDDDEEEEEEEEEEDVSEEMSEDEDEKMEENGDANKKGGNKRKAEEDISELPKKIKLEFDCENEEIKAQYKRLEDYDLRSLFIRFPAETTEDDIKALSSDILSVRMGRGASYAQLLFASEALAEKNLKQLKEKSIDGQHINVSFRGIKVGRMPPMGDKLVYALDRSKLQIKGLAKGTSEDDLKKAFPKCIDVKTDHTGFNGFVNFSSEKDAKEEFDKSVDRVINKQIVDVLYATILMPYAGQGDRGSPKGFRGGRGKFSRGSFHGHDQGQRPPFNRRGGGFRGRGQNRGRGGGNRGRDGPRFGQ